MRALILTPTRELAAQVEESVRLYGKHVPLRSAVVFGGVSINPQIALLRRGVDVLVATPGRLLDHASQGNVDLGGVEIFVLDEADRMLDMGFLPDIRRMLALLPAKRQNLLFSATFPDDIRGLAGKLLDAGARRSRAAPNATADRIEQLVYHVEKSDKRALLVAPDQRKATGGRCSSSRARSTAPTASRAARRATGSARPRSTATRARPRARARSRTSRRASARARRDRHRGARPRHRPSFRTS